MDWLWERRVLADLLIGRRWRFGTGAKRDSDASAGEKVADLHG
jgi:hypothetical protein